MSIQIESLPTAKIKGTYTDLEVGRSIVVPTTVNMIIDDVLLSDTERLEMERLHQQKSTFYYP